MAIALKAGVTKQQLDSMVGVHPTAAEELIYTKGAKCRVVEQQAEQREQEKQQQEAGKESAAKAA
jgi:hypothetical protein